MDPDSTIKQLQARIQQLETENSIYQSLIDQFPGLILAMDSQHRYLVCNAGVEKALQRPRNEILGRINADFLPPEAAEGITQPERAILADGQVRQYEEDVVVPGGRRMITHTRKFPIRDANGHIFAVGGIITDVTDRHKADAALVESQAMLRQVLDNIPLSIFWKDRNGVFLGSNLVQARLAGLNSADEVVGKTDYDFPWREFAAAYQADDRAVMESGVARINYEEPILAADGGKGWLRTSKVPLRDREGTIYAVLGMFEDITERRRNEDRLLMFKALAENTPDTIIVGDLENRIMYANPAARQQHPLPDDPVGQPIPLALDTGMTEHNSNVLRALHQFGTWSGRIDYTNRTGARTPGLATAFMIRADDGHPVAIAAIVRNIADQVAQEEERVRLQEQIIATQQAVLREISTPLIPVVEGVLVMPIIGAIDSNRAQQIMDTLLQGIAEQHATTLILDITGVKVVDTQVAGALLRAAQAAQLLGARVVLTGISPEIAQTLVHIGADLSSVTTRSSLQRGIAYAMETDNISALHQAGTRKRMV